MKRFIYKVEIPEDYMSDCISLRNFIKSNLGIEISLSDTFQLWDSISSSWAASWLSIDAHYSGMTREEFLSDEMERRGYIVNDDTTHNYVGYNIGDIQERINLEDWK